jgi:hypothetical protein
MEEVVVERSGSKKGHSLRCLRCSCGPVGCHLRRKVVEFGVSHETHKAKVGRVHSTPTVDRPPVSQSSKSQWTEARGSIWGSNWSMNDNVEQE